MRLLATLLNLGLAATIVWLLIHFLRPLTNLRIELRDGHVETDGDALRGLHSVLAEFFRNDLPEVRDATITGFWYRRSRQLELRCRGDLSPGHRQRLRNFLFAIL